MTTKKGTKELTTMKACITLTNAALTGLMLFVSAANATALPSGDPDLGDVADRYVQSEVTCYSGRANVAVRSHSSGIEQVSFESIRALDTDSKLSPVTCRDGEFRLGGKTLTNSEVATFAITTRAVAAGGNDWVLIITPINQPATQVPGFSSEVACEQAGNIWQGRDRAKDELPGHVVCVQL